MYEYINGKIIELNPAFIIIEANGIGYFVNISLNTYSKFNNSESTKIFLHQVVREDALILFGFYDKNERDVFRRLISVSGVGPNTARMMLSSLSAEEIRSAILHSDVILLKSVKGIGAKTAQRIILDLKDKLIKPDKSTEIFVSESNRIKEEALSALEILGFSKNAVEKAINKQFIENSSITVEELIKLVLKQF
ncbi:MAG: Holliday junction branch migration protein RuvA [Chlorobi bacterium]|nr:Holliday junction branch migration protein RuvA [Chlorobiota bacterium]